MLEAPRPVGFPLYLPEEVMDRNHVLGMICGYYLSRFDDQAYAHLGFPTQQATHQALGRALGVPAESIKNWRDEFDPVHTNVRQGWHKREMYPSRRRTIEALGELTEPELFSLVRAITESPAGASASIVLDAIEEPDPAEDSGGGAFGLRGPAGIAAERAFMDYHTKSGEPVSGDLADRRADQCGFDFEVVSGDTRVVIEVKGLAGKAGGITFTDKEWATAQKLGDAYYLALVRHAMTEPEITLLRNPAAKLDAQMRTYTRVQVGWSVGDRAIREASETKLPPDRPGT